MDSHEGSLPPPAILFGMRILVVEDNPKIASAIQSNLEGLGYAVDVAHLGHRAEELLASDVYDLIVLDLMLPDRDGVEICRNARRMGLTVPILVLTALSGIDRKVQGLDAGADDYLTKPFEFEELNARVRALFRRGQANESTVLTYGDITLDLLKRRVERAGHEIRLSAKEFSLLEYFMRHPDRVLTRSEITESAWDMRYEPSSNVVDVYVSSLRKKLDKDFDSPRIHTVVGSGYSFGSP